jgi:hypothetical protein
MAARQGKQSRLAVLYDASMARKSASRLLGHKIAERSRDVTLLALIGLPETLMKRQPGGQQARTRGGESPASLLLAVVHKAPSSSPLKRDATGSACFSQLRVAEVRLTPGRAFPGRIMEKSHQN